MLKLKGHIAIIDMGTNTFHLLIVSNGKHGSIEVNFREQLPVKLGKEGIQQNLIAGPAFERGILALQHFSKIINRHNCKEVFAFGTSMLRNAKNSEEFITSAKEILKAPLYIIDGNTEAELIYHGVKQIVAFTNKPYLIMDIGGGSVEFIIASADEIYWKRSYEIGVARLKEVFKDENPMSHETISGINEYLTESLQDLLQKTKEFNVDTLVGAAGSFETLAEIDILRYMNNAETPITHHIDLGHFDEMYQKITSSTYDEIVNIPGMVEFRAEMMGVAVVLINWVKNHASINRMIFSDYSLKEGIIWCYMNKRLEHMIS